MGEKSKELQAFVREADAVKALKQKLLENPDDPEANLALGKFLCLTKGEWEQGLPLLAKGSDAILKALAEKELAAPTDSESQVAIGDGWWNLAEKASGAQKMRQQQHVGSWYAGGVPGLTGLTKAKVEKRLETIRSSESVQPVSSQKQIKICGTG